MNDLDDLRATYGKEAQFSEHKIGDRIVYTSAEGLRSSGTIIWIQERFGDIPQKLVIAPDIEGSFIDFALPADVIAVTQDEPTLQKCPYWGHHIFDTTGESC